MKKGYFGKYGGSFVSPKIQQELDKLEKDKIVVINLSGREDKDVEFVLALEENYGK